MSGNNDELDRVEAQVLCTVQATGTRFSPTELIVHLTGTGLPEEVVRVATWYLINRREIQLNPDWKLSPVESVG